MYNKCYKVEKQDVTSLVSFQYMKVLLRSPTTVLTIGVLKSVLYRLDFVKVVRLVFWSGVVGPGTSFRSLALRARTVALRAQKLDL